MTSQAPTSRGPTDAGLTARVLSSEWQPISTAPKDGTYILAFPSLREIPLVLVWERDLGPAFWRVPLSGQETPYEPTHWMPIPTPPTNPKGAA